jgi:hypothetical protein
MIFQPFAIISQAPFDPDAQAYITAVEAADGQALEDSIRIAINNFVVGCKADGIWDAIKASCILAGARTLSGSLTPLKGTAPTNFNFVSGDYNRKTGLKGDGTSKILNTNRANNADPQNSKHLATFVSEALTVNALRFLIGADLFGTSGASYFGASDSPVNSTSFRANSPANSFSSIADAGNRTGFWGISRNQTAVRACAGSLFQDFTENSASPTSTNLLVFARGTSTSPSGLSDARQSFYSIGESLDLALLDTRVTDLINAIGAAI